MSLDQRSHTIQAVDIQAVPVPQEIVAIAVRSNLVVLVGVGDDMSNAPVVRSQVLGEPLRRARHLISVTQHEFVVLQVKMDVAKVHDHRTTFVLRLEEVRRVLVDWLREDQHIGLGVVQLCPKLTSRDQRPVSIGRHMLAAVVAEGGFHE